MARRGPIPPTYGRSAVEVARVAIRAHVSGRRMSAAVAAHFGCTEEAARAAIYRARRAGENIPSDLGANAEGGPRAHGMKPIPHGTETGYRYGCRETCCRTAHARDTLLRRRARNGDAEAIAALAPKVPRPPTEPEAWRPRSPLGLACTCGQPADTIDALTRHTLAAHHRAPTRTERTPRRNEVAA